MFTFAPIDIISSCFQCEREDILLEENRDREFRVWNIQEMYRLDVRRRRQRDCAFNFADELDNPPPGSFVMPTNPDVRPVYSCYMFSYDRGLISDQSHVLEAV